MLVSKKISVSSSVSGKSQGQYPRPYLPYCFNLSIQLIFVRQFASRACASWLFLLRRRDRVNSFKFGYGLRERILLTTILTNLGRIGTGAQSRLRSVPSPLFGSRLKDLLVDGSILNAVCVISVSFKNS